MLHRRSRTPSLTEEEGVRAAYAAHGGELYRFALRTLGDAGLAQDAVQETFLRAWRARDRYDPAVSALRTWLFGYTQANPAFLRLMTQNALDVEPPLGIIRAFAVDDEPGAKGTLDLKTRGTRIFVDCARVFALAHGIAETGTAARLTIAGERLGIERRHVQATLHAFHFLQLLRLRQQEQPPLAGHPNRLDPYSLHEVDQRMLKEAYRMARQLQERLRLSYRL